MIHVPVGLDRTFHLDAGLDAAYALLSDIPAWASLFPRVASLETLPDQGEAAWRWALEPLGPPGFEVQTVYGCRYTFDAERHTVAWTPLDGVGNARFEGWVVLSTADDGTAGALRLDAVLEIPAPRFARAIVQPAVAFEMGRMTDVFLGRIQDRLEDGRPSYVGAGRPS